MENKPRIRARELIFGTGSKSQYVEIEKLLKRGELKKIAPRIYTSNFRDDPAKIIQRNWLHLLSALYPSALLSHRSALELRPTTNHHLFLTHSYTKNITLPGLTLHFLAGPGKMEGDFQLYENTFCSHEAGALLENLQPSRQSDSLSKTLPQEVVEERLESVLKTRNTKGLLLIREQAHICAKALGMEKEYGRLNDLIEAFITRSPKKLVSEAAKSFVLGEPVDISRVSLFEKLYNTLCDATFPQHIDMNDTTQSFENFAFYESYFSNYIEGTRFEVEEAKQIIATQQPLPARNEESHDVLGTRKIVSGKEEMMRCPNTHEELVQLLQDRHAILLSARKSLNPGHFKDKNNFAGNTSFVDHREVSGTLKRGFEFYKILREPFAKAIFIKLMITEIHPFSDGNGRISRIMMNAELTKAGLSKIIIPVIYREEYIETLQRVSKRENETIQRDIELYIQMMLKVWNFSKNIYDNEIENMHRYLEKLNAFKEQPKLMQ